MSIKRNEGIGMKRPFCLSTWRPFCLGWIKSREALFCYRYVYFT